MVPSRARLRCLLARIIRAFDALAQLLNDPSQLVAGCITKCMIDIDERGDFENSAGKFGKRTPLNLGVLSVVATRPRLKNISIVLHTALFDFDTETVQPA